jgi:hypothetical protein
MNNQKSTMLIAIGVAVFIVAGGLLFLVVRHNDHKSPKATTISQAAVPTTVVSSAAASTPTAASGTAPPVVVPKGDNAVAVSMEYFSGVAGYVHANDHVNIYVVANKGCAANPVQSQLAKLLLSNVQVLAILGPAPAAGGGPSSFLLALTPQQSELIIYHHAFDSLYFGLTSVNEPAAATSGITCANAF